MLPGPFHLLHLLTLVPESMGQFGDFFLRLLLVVEEEGELLLGGGLLGLCLPVPLLPGLQVLVLILDDGVEPVDFVSGLVEELLVLLGLVLEVVDLGLLAHEFGLHAFGSVAPLGDFVLIFLDPLALLVALLLITRLHCLHAFLELVVGSLEFEVLLLEEFSGPVEFLLELFVALLHILGFVLDGVVEVAEGVVLLPQLLDLLVVLGDQRVQLFLVAVQVGLRGPLDLLQLPAIYLFLLFYCGLQLQPPPLALLAAPALCRQFLPGRLQGAVAFAEFLLGLGSAGLVLVGAQDELFVLGV